MPAICALYVINKSGGLIYNKVGLAPSSLQGKLLLFFDNVLFFSTATNGASCASRGVRSLSRWQR
jgi:hypothetical protein